VACNEAEKLRTYFGVHQAVIGAIGGKSDLNLPLAESDSEEKFVFKAFS
jgi:hypothetical protein